MHVLSKECIAEIKSAEIKHAKIWKHRKIWSPQKKHIINNTDSNLIQLDNPPLVVFTLVDSGHNVGHISQQVKNQNIEFYFCGAEIGRRKKPLIRVIELY
jgi:hypothetical protein